MQNIQLLRSSTSTLAPATCQKQKMTELVNKLVRMTEFWFWNWHAVHDYPKGAWGRMTENSKDKFHGNLTDLKRNQISSKICEFTITVATVAADLV